MSGKILIVTYHYVRDQPSKFPGIHPVSKYQLNQDIRKLKSKYQALNPSQLHKLLTNRAELKEDYFFLTFDDGLKEHSQDALEVIDENKLKAAFFIPTLPIRDKVAPSVHKIHWLRGNISPKDIGSMFEEKLPSRWKSLKLTAEQQKEASSMHIHDIPEVQHLKFALNFVYPTKIIRDVLSEMFEEIGIDDASFCNETFMSANDLRSLSKLGHVIGAHGHSHEALSKMTDKNAMDDVHINMKHLSETVGHRITWLSYPYGRPSALPRKTSELCNGLSIELAFSLVSGFVTPKSNFFSLERITPNEIDNYL
jgi:peptidoglycan/xylan/chitin deacetylase (PgdA/CDA1 family)